VQDLKLEIKAIKKSQRETTLEIENLGERLGVIEASISKKTQEIEDTIRNIDTTVKENAKCKKLLTPNIQDIQDTMRNPNLMIIGPEESEVAQLKGLVNIFNKL
jgi:predicted  nucleic acid-binding Zn-ribbon protein